MSETMSACTTCARASSCMRASAGTICRNYRVALVPAKTTPEQYAAKWGGEIMILTGRESHINADDSVTVTEVTFPCVARKVRDEWFYASVYPALIEAIPARRKEYPDHASQEWFGARRVVDEYHNHEDAFSAIMRTAE